MYLEEKNSLWSEYALAGEPVNGTRAIAGVENIQIGCLRREPAEDKGY